MVIIDNNRSGFFKNLWKKNNEEVKELEPEAAAPAENIMKEEPKPDFVDKILTSQAYDLWKKWKELKKENTDGVLRIDFYHKEVAPLEEYLTDEAVAKRVYPFVNLVEQTAQKTLFQLLDMEMKRRAEEEKDAEKDLKAATESGKERSEEERARRKAELKEKFLRPVHSQILVDVPEDSMWAFICVLPPFYGGKEPVLEEAEKLVKMQRIVFGREEGILEKICDEKLYFQLFMIAKGQAPVAGKDGWVEELWPRASEMTIEEDENGIVDYKNLNLIQNIKKESVICNIVLPTKGEPGRNVRGEPVAPVDGKAAQIPRGKDTVVSADGTALVAAIDGYLSFEHGKFRVANRLEIEGNVDNSIGNIFFLGDVIIRGDVFNGFSVKATGNIHVKGMVEGAVLKAGGSVVVEKGINGNKQGSVEAQGDLESKFLENCTVYAGGCIQTESIIWSDVNCDDKVMATKSKGVIIGGSVTAKTSVEAKIIGNKSNQKTVITLGYSPKLLQEKKETEEKQKETLKMLEEIIKNVSYLEKAKKMQPLSDEKQKHYKQLGLQKILFEKKKKSLDLKSAAIAAEMADLTECRLKAGMIFPDTKVVIGFCSKTIETVSSRCNLYINEGDIVLGSY